MRKNIIRIISTSVNIIVIDNACGKLGKNEQKKYKKSIDTSIFLRYYRDSFWIKKLFKRSKQKFSQNNSTLYKEDRFSSQLPVFFYGSNRVAIYH